MPTNAFEAGRLLASCDAAVFRGLRRPGNVEIRRTWMRRFVKEMHWLSAVELLSGCRADTDPVAHAALMAAIADEAVPRVGHRPWGRQERHWWSMLLGDSLGPLCPSPAAQGLARSATLTLRDGEGDVFFVANAAIAAAEAARPACLQDTQWLYYKAVKVMRGELPPDEHRLMLGYRIGDDPAAVAYFDFLKLLAS